MSDFPLPDLGEGLTEAEIVAWQVGVGDEVAVDQVVVEVETAKASVEVPIPTPARCPRCTAGRRDRRRRRPLITVGTPLRPPARCRDGSEYSGNVLIGYGSTAGRGRRAARRAAPSPRLRPQTSSQIATSRSSRRSYASWPATATSTSRPSPAGARAG